VAAVGRDDISGDLAKRHVSAQQDATLRRLAVADEDVAALLEMLAGQLLDGVCRRRTENVDIDSRRRLGEHAGVAGKRVDARPEGDLLAAGIALGLPRLHCWALGLAGQRRKAGVAQL